MRRSFPGILIALLVGAVVSAQQQEPPRFTASVDVTPIDVSVLDGSGRPVPGLSVTDFTVTVDGSPRRIVSAEWVPLAVPPGAEPPPAPPPGYSSNEQATGGRLIIIAVDEPNIRFGGAVGIRAAVERFIDRLQPSDRIAAVGLGLGSASTPFTADRARVKQAIGRMAGQRMAFGSDRYRIGLAEAIQVRRGDVGALERVVARECASEPPGALGLESCRISVEAEVARRGQTLVEEAGQAIGTLRRLLSGLAVIDVPKTIVFVSEGFVTLENESLAGELSALAAAARASVYVLRLDEPVFDISQREAPIARIDDRQELAQGLDMLTSATRGSIFTVAVGADGIFDRIASELSGYYLLAVETEPGDHDGRSHPLRVRVGRTGVTVRARRELGRKPADSRPANPRAMLAAALASPLPIAALPLRTATFAMRTPDGNIQLVIHAEVGAGYTSPQNINLGYYIINPAGDVVESQMATARLRPVMNGVPSALQYSSSASLPPGEYTLKMAVADGDTVGTVEHPVHAMLLDAPPLALSELLVGGPVDGGARITPTVGHTVSFGTVQGYMEAYGLGAAGITVNYEVAADAEAAPLLNAEVTARTAGDDRAIFSKSLPVRQLPPGPYVLRARISADGVELKTMSRPFEVAPPPVLMTSAEGASASARSSNELFLPVGDELFARPFVAAEATRPDTIERFRNRVAPATAASFDAGVAQFAAGDYTAAERSFKSAIETEQDSSPALTYLAAVFAAVGRDAQAAGAWQTALIEGDDQPQIYLWLGDALLRSRDLAQARAILEEASSKWPADTRFAKPMALVYATFGEGREAVRTLERHLEASPSDVDAHRLMVEWIYTLHTNTAVARNRAEDVALARRSFAAYEKGKGPQLALLRQWMSALEGRR